MHEHWCQLAGAPEVRLLTPVEGRASCFVLKSFAILDATTHKHAMTKPTPRELYQTLAVNLRSRLDFAESVIAKPFARPFQTVETIALQGRKCVETIAYMMLVATEKGFGRANMPRDARTQWNAEPIFQSLKKKGLDLIPSPQRIAASKTPGIKLEIVGVAEDRLSYDDLSAIYRTFHKGLHEPNPYVQAVDDEYYTKIIPDLTSAMIKIKKLTWRHMIFIRGSAFLCVLSDDNGKVGVTGLDKEEDLPKEVSDQN